MSKQESIFSEEQNLEIELQSAEARISELQNQNKKLAATIEWLTEQLNSLQRYEFGSKAERWEAQEQMLLLNEAELESQNPDSEKDDEEATVNVKKYQKKRGHRKALPEKLSREIIKVELPQAEQLAEDGTPLLLNRLSPSTTPWLNVFDPAL